MLNADYIIDLGPEGGEKGGYIVGKGTARELTAKNIEKWDRPQFPALSYTKSVTARYEAVSY